MIKGIDYTGIAVVYFCHDGKGNFLMNKRNQNCRDEKGCWDIGGGALEHLDSVENTLRNEIRQEYSTEVIDFEFLGYRDVHREVEGRKTHWIALDFKVLVNSATVKNGEPHKFDEIRWVTKDTIPQPLHSQLPVFFEKYKEKLF